MPESMWFKRRKKTEQDDALSESLKSLQTLLSETGRQEPSLAPGQTPPDAHDASAAGGDEPTARGDRPDPGQAGLDEPAASDSGSRWRDLDLSFDAEPVVPRARRESIPAEDDAAPPTPDETTHGPEAEAEADAGTGFEVETDAEAAIEAGAEAAVPAEPDTVDDEQGTDEAIVHYDGTAGYPPGGATADETRAAEMEDETPPTPQNAGLFHSYGEEPELEIDLDDVEPETPAEALPGDEPAAPPLSGYDVSVEDPAPQTRSDPDPAEIADEDIPTLTDAVYVPDEATAGPEPAAPDPAPDHGAPASAPPAAEPMPPAQDAAQCLSNLRERLQRQGLAPLSPEQEKALRDTLVALLQTRDRG